MIHHGDDHRNKDDGIVEEVQLDTRDHQLKNAGPNRRTKEVDSNQGLSQQQGVLEKVPDLNG